MKTLLIVSTLLVGCGTVATPPTDDSADAVALPTCSGVPSGLDGSKLLGDGEAFYSASPNIGDQVYVAEWADLAAYYFQGRPPQTASVVYTTDGWATKKTAALTNWCQADNGGTAHNIFGLSLGTFSTATTIQFAIEEDDTGAGDGTFWLNNHSKNYTINVTAPAPLTYVGGTRVLSGGTITELSKTAAGNDLKVYTQTYPRGAAKTITLNWGASRSVVMNVNADGVGPYGDNTEWVATIPAADLIAGAPLSFYVKASDGTNTLYDSQNGANYNVVPVAYPITFLGNFGHYQPSDYSYTMSSNEQISSGCNNGGADEYSFSAPAIQIYVPGITDQGYDPETAASLITGNVTVNGKSFPISYSGATGNNFIYMFLVYNDLCGGDGTGSIPDGTYPWTLTASTDQSTTSVQTSGTLTFQRSGYYSF